MGDGPQDGTGTAVVLGGGGLFLLAWHVGYLDELRRRGIDLHDADLHVGTSAGSIAATLLAAGRIERVHRLIARLEDHPGLITRLASGGEPSPSQVRARDLFWTMRDAEPATIREVGHAALAASTPSADTTARTIGLLLGRRRWPSDTLRVTCTDTYTGERRVVSSADGVALHRAVAASCSVPGIFSPQPIGDARCMDGGVGPSGVHADLATGHRCAVVLALPDFVPPDAPVGTRSVTDVPAELAALRAGGTEVFHRSPREADIERLMDPLTVPVALDMGRDQARGDADELRAVLAARPPVR